MMYQMGLEWINDPYDRYSDEWDLNLTRLVDSVHAWCKDSGIRYYGISFTQIALSVTFLLGKDAMMFKLRWHGA